METDRILFGSLVGRMVEFRNIDLGASSSPDECESLLLKFRLCRSVGSFRVVLVFVISLLGAMIRVDTEICEGNPVGIARETAGRRVKDFPKFSEPALALLEARSRMELNRHGVRFDIAVFYSV